MSESVKVTVYLSTYNQEEFVAQALDSILMQKTTFKYELLAADDCSTDGTQAVILAYQKKYPDIIKTYFTPVNVGGCRKLTDCIDKGLLQGEYIANLEGDDYWLEEDRLQTLVDFLDANPKYSRVSHKRRVIDENEQPHGYDTKRNVLNKDFYITDFLAGKQYSDFGSVFRNYYREAGTKYHSLLQASRNVCDFQDMFITQDFGPVYVMDKCFGVYRSRNVQGASNYNSITTREFRCRENIRLAKAVESFYEGKYDLSPMILSNQKRLLEGYITERKAEEFRSCLHAIGENNRMKVLAEICYQAWRNHRGDDTKFIRSALSGNEKLQLNIAMAGHVRTLIANKISHKKVNIRLRGYLVK